MRKVTGDNAIIGATRMKYIYSLSLFGVILLTGGFLSCRSMLCRSTPDAHEAVYIEPVRFDIEDRGTDYPVHRDIQTTLFYIGEYSRGRHSLLNNRSSAWTGKWVESYGGIDHPDKRENHLPAGFEPLENPFYCALPYNDLNGSGHKENASIIYWSREIPSREEERITSYCKNRWVRIAFGDRVCYAQWQDVGPYETDDAAYVFGTGKPANRINEAAGLDLSPACFHYLGMEDNGRTDWQFVEFFDVPDGPWLDTITISNPCWD